MTIDTTTPVPEPEGAAPERPEAGPEPQAAAREAAEIVETPSPARTPARAQREPRERGEQEGNPPARREGRSANGENGHQARADQDPPTPTRREGRGGSTPAIVEPRERESRREGRTTLINPPASDNYVPNRPEVRERHEQGRAPDAEGSPLLREPNGSSRRDGRPAIVNPGENYQNQNGEAARQQRVRIAEEVAAVLAELESKSREELQELANSLNLAGAKFMKKPELVNKVLQARAQQHGQHIASGLLELLGEGYGFLRQSGVRPTPGDVYVSPSQIRRFGLRTGDLVVGGVRPPKDGEKYWGLLRVDCVDGMEPEVARQRPVFERFTPIYPDRQIKMETTPKNLSNRLIDMLAPIGKGQRGLIVSPPKAGKTMLLKSIAAGITANAPDIELMVCLVGERPEEVTDMERSVKGDVFSSTFDDPVEDHTRVAELVLERAKRLVESGKDVAILLDSITRLARAYNLAVPTSGRTLSGGMDPVALYPPKKFFGAARNTEDGGSLTIIATCLVDTGSRMDDLIYEEFKGTGNMELHLDRKLADRRIYPAIDILRSGTRHEELLLKESELRQVWLLRRIVAMIGSDSTNGHEATEKVLERLAKTATNAEFMASLNKAEV